MILRTSSRLAVAALLLALLGCAGTPPPPGGPGWHHLSSAETQRVLSWRVDGLDAIPRNVPCDLEVELWREGRPLAAHSLAVRGWMPDHGHGFARLPEVREVAPGRWRVDGLLLHMRGTWLVHFDVLDDDGHETLTLELEL